MIWLRVFGENGSLNGHVTLQRRAFTGADIDLRQRPEAPRSGAYCGGPIQAVPESARPEEHWTWRERTPHRASGATVKVTAASEKLEYPFKQRGPPSTSPPLTSTPNSWDTVSSNYFPPFLKRLKDRMRETVILFYDSFEQRNILFSVNPSRSALLFLPRSRCRFAAHLNVIHMGNK